MNTDYSYIKRLIEKEVVRSLTEYPHRNKKTLKVALHLAKSPSHLWRPLLCTTIWKILTSKTYHQIMPVACSAELCHIASMIADDLPMMDDAQTRRGKISCHRAFGTHTAILSVPWMCDVADGLVHHSSFSKESMSLLKRLLWETRAGMMSGQLMDLANNGTFSVAEILEMYRLKSGVLYAYATASPALAIGDEKKARALKEMGECLGVAYQIADDIFDIEGTPHTLGKGVNMDEGKPTLPRVIGMSAARQKKEVLKSRSINICRELFGGKSRVEFLIDQAVV